MDEDQIKANFENGVLEVKIPERRPSRNPSASRSVEAIARTRQLGQLADDFEDGKEAGLLLPRLLPGSALPCSPSRRRRRSGRMLLYRFSATDKTSPRGG